MRYAWNSATKTSICHLEIDTSGIGLGTALLQTMDGMTCSKDAAPDNSILRQSHLQVKSWPAQKEGTVTLKEGGVGILHGPENISPLLLC